MTNWLTWLKWKFVTFCHEYDFPGDDVPVIRGSALKALEGDPEQEQGYSSPSWTSLTNTSQLQSVLLTSHS